MKESLLKGLSSGVVAAVAANFILTDSSLTFANMELPSSVVVGGSVAVGSIVGDYVAENIIDQMNLPQNIKSTEELLVRFGLSGTASTAVLMAGGNDINLINGVLLGGVSKLGGDYVYQMVLSPKGVIGPLW